MGGTKVKIGQRIKQARIHRGLTQKELGMMVGFDERTADVRIAQYEASARTPKADLRDKLAGVLNVNGRYFLDSCNDTAEDMMFRLFDLDYKYKLELTPIERNGENMVNIHVPNQLLNEFLTGWMEKKQALSDGGISETEYTEWKLNWFVGTGEE